MKKVAVIQDLSSFGKCSLTAAIPVLSVMGVQACPLPTAILSAQTDYPSFFYEDFTSKMQYFEEEWSKLEITFDGIYTGFVTGQEQINNIFRFLDKFKSSDTLVLVDPVMGDKGEAYKLFTEELLVQMRELVKRANVITPNVTECCLLTGLSYEKLHNYSNKEDFIKALEEAGNALQQQTKAKIIVTGVNPPSNNMDKQFVGNLYLDGTGTFYSEIPYNGKSYSGTGDLFASVVMGSLMRGEDLQKSLQLAQEFLTAAIHDTYLEGTPEVEGVNFEKYLKLLL
ncbi:pyridoxine kinase [Ureibacillus massiliensis 4400831 = CIP 108448 = CCUG 49529]|uniref:pyridoxal kinase n=1 Tax=Ureibacillus massiliensis 4400831 = CIP 108448 = CCUG 49529 TaxID=1211035 RepID=A0A0A3J1X0_9BACL|nr:pyridoxamine kinase [Ureibacillus massiliensis]KGR90921.1 pyridoxine kinase [Ureibacillus massiliensis 4400831 = CIP 108448 = CCUG 49529]